MMNSGANGGESINSSTAYLSLRLFIALSLIAALSITAFFALIIYSSSQSSFAPVINLSGRQRMLSQKLVKEALLLVESTTPQEKEFYRARLAETVEIWSRSHAGLQQGDEELGLSGENSGRVRELFAEINPHKERIASSVAIILAEEDIPPFSDPAIQQVVHSSDLFLVGMDQVVNQYELEARERENEYIRNFLFIIVAILVLLGLEALFIFRPLVAKVRLTFEAYQRSNDLLKQDILLREQAETSLRLSEAKYRDLVETSQDLIFRCDRELRFIYLNPAWESILGYPVEEMVGRPFQEFRGERMSSSDYSQFQQVMEGGSIEGLEDNCITKSGQKVHLLINAIPLKNDNGNIIGAQGTAHDITKRKLAEEQREQYSRRLEEANVELSQYAYVVSHDLKTPLRAIHSYADFLYEDLSDSLEGDQAQYLEGLVQAVREADDLVSDLLELSKVGRRRKKLEAVEMNSFLKGLLPFSGQTGEVEINESDHWPAIEAEPLLLRQIFQNLIDNAIKFNSSTTKRVQLGCTARGEHQFDFSVKDNGIGIDPRYQEKIFGVFEQLHIKAKYEGTGIGLAIVKKAAGKLGGSVRVESRLDEGSTFIVTLPKTHEEA